MITKLNQLQRNKAQEVRPHVDGHASGLNKINYHPMKKILQIFLLSTASAAPGFGQQSLSENEAINAALKNNLMVKSGEYSVAYERQLKAAAFDLGRTSVNWMHGQYNSILKDNNYTISQTIPFPSEIVSKAKLANAQIEGAAIQLTMTKNELVKAVRSLYHQLAFLNTLNRELFQQDSVYSRFVSATQVRFRVGESTLLEKTTAETQLMEIKNQLQQNISDQAIYQRQLQTLLNTSEESVVGSELMKLSWSPPSRSVDLNPSLRLARQEITIAERMKKLERNRFFPDITVGYFTQSLIGFQEVNNAPVFFDKDQRFTGFQLGISFPLWFVPQQSRAKAMALNQEATQKRFEFVQLQLEGDLQKAQLELTKHENSLRYYEDGANQNADLLMRQAQRSFEAGEISYLEYLQAINQARIIKINYLEKLNLFNQAVIQLDYIIGTY